EASLQDPVLRPAARFSQTLQHAAIPRATTPSPQSAQCVERENNMRKERSSITPSTPFKQIYMQFYIDPDSFPTMIYSIGKDDVGAAFKSLQKVGAALVNNPAKKATLKNLHCFLAVNYIWDTTSDIGLEQATLRLISEQFRRPKFMFATSHVLLICELEQELAANDIQRTAENNDHLGKEIIDIFWALKKDLPQALYPFPENDDTFVHRVLHSMLSTIFQDFKTVWANKAATGSRERREEDGKEGWCPDLQVIKNDVAVMYLKVKSLESTTAHEYLADRWKLASLAKDELDACYRKHISLPFMTIVQVYGRKLEVYTMLLQNGIYHMAQQFQVYVPCDRADGAAIRPCLSALYSVKMWLSGLCLPPSYQSINSRSPPQELSDIKTSQLTLSKRKLF
ncbi:hypothetical protein BGX34_006065, partial [Mortierella sp. NVP85]